MIVGSDMLVIYWLYLIIIPFFQCATSKQYVYNLDDDDKPTFMVARDHNTVSLPMDYRTSQECGDVISYISIIPLGVCILW